jgi:hypothetical protein
MDLSTAACANELDAPTAGSAQKADYQPGGGRDRRRLLGDGRKRDASPVAKAARGVPKAATPHCAGPPLGQPLMGRVSR